MAEQDRWLLGRLPGWISGPVCAFSIWEPHFAVGQWHWRPTPHSGCGTKRDPIMPVPLRVVTWKQGPTVITAWPSGGEDTLSVSPRRNAWMSLSWSPAWPQPLSILKSTPPFRLALSSFLPVLHLVKQHQKWKNKKDLPLLQCCNLFSVQVLTKDLIFFDDPF